MFKVALKTPPAATDPGGRERCGRRSLLLSEASGESIGVGDGELVVCIRKSASGGWNRHRQHFVPCIDAGVSRCRPTVFPAQDAGRMSGPGGPNTWLRSANQAKPRPGTAERGDWTRSISPFGRASCARLRRRSLAWSPWWSRRVRSHPFPRWPRRFRPLQRKR